MESDKKQRLTELKEKSEALNLKIMEEEQRLSEQEESSKEEQEVIVQEPEPTKEDYLAYIEELEKQINQPHYKKVWARENKIPVNNLDSAWLSAEPDYTLVQNTFQKEDLVAVFEFFTSAIRLGNITNYQANRLSYRLDTAGYAYSLGKIKVALTEFFQIAGEIELSHGVKGFRTQAMNMVIQKIEQTQDKRKKRGVMGNTKED